MKRLTFLFATILLTMNCSFAAEASSSEIANAEPVNDSVSINETMEIATKTNHEEDQQTPYTIDVIYPQIAGTNLPASALEFNRLINEMINKSVQQFKNYVKADMVHMQTLPDSVKHNSLHINYDVDIIKPANHILVSARLSIEGMQAGRAHPYHSHQVLNFDLANGKTISFKDIFKPNSNYLSALSQYSAKNLNAKLQDKWMITSGTAPLAKNYQNWNLDDNGILLTFDEYQAAPYAAGPQEVHIPYNTLKELLAANAPIATCAKSAVGCGAMETDPVV